MGGALFTESCSGRVQMALSKYLAPQNLLDLPDEPNQPPSVFVFPKHELGKAQIVKRSCQSAWFSKWKWLHHCE